MHYKLLGTTLPFTPQVEKAMNQLADMQGMTCVWSLYEAHANNIIHSIKVCLE